MHKNPKKWCFTPLSVVFLRTKAKNSHFDEPKKKNNELKDRRIEQSRERPKNGFYPLVHRGFGKNAKKRGGKMMIEKNCNILKTRSIAEKCRGRKKAFYPLVHILSFKRKQGGETGQVRWE